MLGIRFIKAGPTDFLIHYKNGVAVRAGVGLSFFYYAPTSSLVRVPVGSVDVPFIFEEVTADFQAVSVQGQLTYRIAEAQKLSALIDFTLDPGGRAFASDDPDKLPRRLVQQAQVLTATALKKMPLRDALVTAPSLAATIRAELAGGEAIASLGIELLGLSILAIRPTPETLRALEAEAREGILGKADEAIYARRNAAVEQERAIKENELNTEIAIESKKRQIRETQMEAEKSIAQKQRELREAEMAANVTLEEQRRRLVELAAANSRDEADARAYAVGVVMQALAQTDPRTLQTLASVGMDPGQLVALAFHDLAAGAEKIGELNVSPDLLRELLERPAPRDRSPSRSRPEGGSD